MPKIVHEPCMFKNAAKFLGSSSDSDVFGWDHDSSSPVRIFYLFNSYADLSSL